MIELLQNGSCFPEPTGQVIAVSGSEAMVWLTSPLARSADGLATVGKFLGIRTERSLVIGMLTKVSVKKQVGSGPQDCVTGQLDLLGEVKAEPTGRPHFQRGVTEYPMIGDPVELITNDQLRTIFDIAGPNTIEIGQLQQDASIGAYIDVNETVSKHFAVFGTTGVGKSSGVAVILNQIMDVKPDLRIFLIDLHNEYGPCFGERAQVLTPRNLKLPFWLFNFEETIDVFFKGRPGLDEEVEILSELIPMAKSGPPQRQPADRPNLRIKDSRSMGYTVDTPVPYRLQDLIALIDERIGALEYRPDWIKYHRLKTRIEKVRNDPRYSFMFENANVGGDTMVDVLSQLFRLPPDGVPMSIMQLAGFPGEVVDALVSVLCRMAFEFGLWSDGAFPLLFVCEEAHRYAPSDRSTGFGPSRKAVSRIAKEGRKYGVFLGLVTQRPSELDAAIVSQCSTLFAMRLANDRDQSIVRAAVSDAAASLVSFVPSLGAREVFAFGDGVAIPTRLRFMELPEPLFPKSEAVSRARMGSRFIADRGSIASVVGRWRGATMSRPLTPEDAQPKDAIEECPAVRPSSGQNGQGYGPTLRKTPGGRPESHIFPVEDVHRKGIPASPVPRLGK